MAIDAGLREHRCVSRRKEVDGVHRAREPLRRPIGVRRAATITGVLFASPPPSIHLGIVLTARDLCEILGRILGRTVNLSCFLTAWVYPESPRRYDGRIWFSDFDWKVVRTVGLDDVFTLDGAA